MSKIIRTLLSAATFSMLLAACTQSVAGKHQELKDLVNHNTPNPQENNETVETINLKGFLCKDVMRLTGDERDIALAFMHGYYLDKKEVTEYKVGTLANTSDEFMEYCLDHPADIALDVMGKFLK